MKRDGRTKKKYYCLECDNIISYQSALYGSHKCFRCSNKYKALKHGKTSRSLKYYCKECGKEITYQSAIYGDGRCKNCANKITGNKMKGRKSWNKGIKNSTGIRSKEINKNTIIKHHIYLKENSNKIMKISQGLHISLHWRGYEYLVEIGEVRNYLKEFIVKYDINPLIGDGKVVHHIDCNRENNNSNNFLYLNSMGIHNKLHQEAYKYLIKIGRIDKYIEWFFSKEREKSKIIF